MKQFIFFFLLSSSLYANDICKRTRDYLDLPSSRISFRNAGGLLKGGVCWWHSRMQRASAYLVRYAPEAPRPSQSEVRNILFRLRNMNDVVTIPGFSDFQSFTSVHQKLVQDNLESWQRFDGFINQQWIRSISGRPSLPADKLRVQMDKIFRVHKASAHPVWLMAQLKGITAHAFLLLSMTEAGNGYLLRVIDSNRPEVTRDILYVNGDHDLKLADSEYRFVLYPGFHKDIDSIARTINRHCKHRKVPLPIQIASATFVP